MGRTASYGSEGGEAAWNQLPTHENACSTESSVLTDLGKHSCHRRRQPESERQARGPRVNWPQASWCAFSAMRRTRGFSAPGTSGHSPGPAMTTSSSQQRIEILHGEWLERPCSGAHAVRTHRQSAGAGYAGGWTAAGTRNVDPPRRCWGHQIGAM